MSNIDKIRLEYPKEIKFMESYSGEYIDSDAPEFYNESVAEMLEQYARASYRKGYKSARLKFEDVSGDVILKNAVGNLKTIIDNLNSNSEKLRTKLEAVKEALK
jgi:hypothetical protein